MFVHYVRPQENGEHVGTRYASVRNDATGTRISFKPLIIKDFAFKASHFTDRMIADTAHDFELAPLKETIINLDCRVNSIGLDPLIAKKEAARLFDEKHMKFGFRINIE
jgi:beta-galactosidase